MASAASADLHAPPTPDSTPRAAHRRDIQGLRAIAVLMVVLFHARLPIPGGFTGVDVFFVISGFVITGMLHREWLATGRIRMRTFYLRRFMRLAPALGLLVGVVVLLSVVLQSPFGPQQTVATTGLGALLMSANLVIASAAGDYFAVTATQNPLLNTWSLSVEEQFYLVFPTLLLVGWVLARRLRRVMAPPILIIAGVTALSFLVSVLWTNGGEWAAPLTSLFGGPQVFAFYGPFSRVWEFGVGAILALLIARGWGPGRAAGRIAGVVGAVLVVVSAFAITDVMPFPGTVALVPVAGTALLLVAGAREASFITRGLSTRPMVAVGDWSYSWYLWHWPLIVFVAVILPGAPIALVIAAIASLLPAWLSYRFVEQPLRRVRPAGTIRTALVVAVISGIPIALCLGLLWGANTGWGGRFALPPEPKPASVSAPAAAGDAQEGPEAFDPIEGDGAIAKDTTTGDLRAQHAAVEADCVNTEIDPVGCRFGPANAKGTVLVLGDSQAYAVADGVINAASALGFDTVVSSRTGCPFLGRESSGTNDNPCRPWQKSALAYALSSSPAAVVIANRSAGYVHPEWGWRTAATDEGNPATSVAQAAKLWEEGVESVVAPLRAAGIPVVVIAAVPEMPEFTDQRSLFSQAFGSRAYEVPRKQSIQDRQPALDAEEQVAARHPGTLIFDPIPVLCPTETCMSAVDGVLRYQDETHLTVEGSLLLSPGVQDILGKALTADR
jgi:peptidoglycan/LPS O-acetylase OafA/YrhL